MNIKKDKIRKLILKEIAMLSISPINMSQLFQGCPACGMQDCMCDDYGEDCPACGTSPCCCVETTTAPRGQMSRDACCVAIKAIAECCECPDTRAAFLNLCSSIRH